MHQRPYNLCDYRCERCLETRDCDVYKRLQHEQAGRGDDPAALLKALQASFRETEDMIKEKARALGIDIDDLAGGATAEEIREQHRKTAEDGLYQEAHAFTMHTYQFLKRAEPLVAADAREHLNDIAWHHTVISAKVYRALGWRTDGEIAEDARNSAAVAMKSLTICIMALDEVASLVPELGPDCRILADAGSRLKEAVRKRFLAGPGSRT